jgi:hypothetical protein
MSFVIRRVARRTIATIAVAMAAGTADAQAAPPAWRWYKGNTHTHTLNSDGDSSPDEVARWYREHGYNFLVLSDHNYLTSVDGINAVIGASGQFLLIPGEEITDRVGEKPLHINGLEVQRLVRPQGGATIVEAAQRDIDAIRAASGVPHINHPNFGWAWTVDELKQIQRTRLFEIFNGHPLVNNVGGGGMPGLEEMWDMILSSGKLLYGIAVDDAHHFKRPWDPTASAPGKGWLYVRATELSSRAILAALEAGDFYASTGVELADIQSTPRSMTVTVTAQGTTKFRVQFIGQDGTLLQESVASPATYTFKGTERYVRAKVIDSNGHMAWVQPVMLAK